MTAITLDYPIIVDGAEVRELRMRRPKVRDLLALERSNASDADKELKLFANLCELSPKSLEELDAADYRRLQEAYNAFLSSSPEQSG